MRAGGLPLRLPQPGKLPWGLFRSWLFRIASNCSYDLLRHRQRVRPPSLDHPRGRATTAATPRP